MGEEQKNN